MRKKRVNEKTVKKKRVKKFKMEKIVKKKINKHKKKSVKKEKVVKTFKKNEWTSEMSVEEPRIDEQHQRIINQINILEEKMNDEDTLKTVRESIHFLDRYIKEHFSYEEAYMKKINYPGFQKHKKIHEKFGVFYNELKREIMLKIDEEKDARELARTYIKKVHKFLGEWIVRHIRSDDQGYHRYARKKGIIKNEAKKEKGKKTEKMDVMKITDEIKQEMISQQRKPVEHIKEINLKDKKSGKGVKEYVFTGVPGFDELMDLGIPQGSLIIVAGGAGSGKTILCLQTLMNKCNEGKKCLYMTLEESEEKLINHMEDFGWNAREMVKKKKLKIHRINPFDITRNVDALLAKQKGELLIDIEPVILPDDFSHPDFIAIDSLTAIASAFTGKDESYRIYIEQLFRFLEKTRATGFLITETEQIPKIFSPTGVEEFLADGVIVIYNIKHGNVRESAIEILKLRGASHQKKIVAMQITGEGIIVYPEQEVFSEVD